MLLNLLMMGLLPLLPQLANSRDLKSEIVFIGIVVAGLQVGQALGTQILLGRHFDLRQISVGLIVFSILTFYIFPHNYLPKFILPLGIGILSSSLTMNYLKSGKILLYQMFFIKRNLFLFLSLLLLLHFGVSKNVIPLLLISSILVGMINYDLSKQGFIVESVGFREIFIYIIGGISMSFYRNDINIVRNSVPNDLISIVNPIIIFYSITQALSGSFILQYLTPLYHSNLVKAEKIIKSSTAVSYISIIFIMTILLLSSKFLYIPIVLLCFFLGSTSGIQSSFLHYKEKSLYVYICGAISFLLLVFLSSRLNYLSAFGYYLVCLNFLLVVGVKIICKQ